MNRTGLAAALLAAVLLLTGCGGAGSAAVPAAEPTAAPTAEITATPAPTPEPTPTPTPEPTPTPTPRPLSPEEEAFRESERMYFVELRYEDAFYRLRSAQYDGYAPTLTLLGRCRYFGTGVVQNYKEAYQFFCRAALIVNF